jgi:hypothetical protein
MIGDRARKPGGWGRTVEAVLLASACLVSPQASSQAECAAGIEFYEDGRFRSCLLTANQRIASPDGVRIHCRHGQRLELHPDGSLKRCTLDRPAELPGRYCEAGREIRLTPSGELEAC